ncbi:hypothetical protein DL95DRAFT_506494 [Leptodontidium sp. 2 PMI_412]|nr:hypothetical protein DL95DRAFT_506494 [Leptodontidium sp. 2 PMI_412]
MYPLRQQRVLPMALRPSIRSYALSIGAFLHLTPSSSWNPRGRIYASIAYWQQCLSLARRLIRLFALALDLDENHFDCLITFLGADCVYNFCPGKSPAEAAIAKDVGLGSHTDPQYFTLLWQDLIGGLQVLTREGEWIKATPISGTIVVNIGDFLQGVSNDRFVRTVHGIFSRAQSDRISMPFFFGFNFNEKVGVLESCLGEGEFAKYEPVSCGEPGRYEQD